MPYCLIALLPFYLTSTFAVASSMTRILLLFSRALARQMSCLWPILKLHPFSETKPSSPPSIISIVDLSWTYIWVSNCTKSSNSSSFPSRQIPSLLFFSISLLPSYLTSYPFTLTPNLISSYSFRVTLMHPPTFSRTLHSSASLYISMGSKLYLTVPLKRTGSFMRWNHYRNSHVCNTCRLSIACLWYDGKPAPHLVQI